MMQNSDDLLLPKHGSCFVCSHRNEAGMQIDWYGRPDRRSLYGNLTLGDSWEGPPAHAHGGAVAALLDDAMGLLAWYAGYQVMTAKMTVSYRRPTPLHQPLRVEARVEDKRGRKVSVYAVIRNRQGDVTAESEGLFVEIPEMFASERATDFTHFRHEAGSE